jgi:hypothetical protein
VVRCEYVGDDRLFASFISDYVKFQTCPFV